MDQALGLGAAAGAGLLAGGQPIDPKGLVMRGASRGTYPISKGLSRLLPMKLPMSVPAPTANNPGARSNVIGRVLGRWAPFVGLGISSYEYTKYLMCLGTVTKMNANNDAIVSKVLNFLSEFLSIPLDRMNMSTSICRDLGVDGDDALEMLDAYSKEFEVSLEGFDTAQYFGQEISLHIFGSHSKKDETRKKRDLYINDLVIGVRIGRLSAS